MKLAETRSLTPAGLLVLLVGTLGLLLAGGIGGLAMGGYNWTLSFLLLGSFSVFAGVCLLLVVRLTSRSDQITRANLALERRNAEVVRATDAKSRFLANMSHELRTPLNSIIGFTELMHSGRLGPIDSEHREYLGIIRDSADHLVALVDDVLDLAQIEAGHLRLEPRPIDPAQIAAQCIESLQGLAVENEIDLALHAPPAGRVLLDPGRLRQVFLNYLANAIKFTGPHGSVEVAISREANELLIAVRDTGPGIEPIDQSRVFDEFVQLNRGHHRGRGLGLAVTKLIVESQGGTVGVRSRPGSGATFHARIPVVAVPDQPDNAATPKPEAVSAALAEGRR